MATKEKKGAAPAAKATGGKGGDRKSMLPKGPHAGATLPAPAPRLAGYYKATVAPRLMQQFGLTNTHQVPALTKIVINVGLGEAIKQPKLLDSVVEELALITGQRPVRKKAKKSIANFG
ncbi:MAG: 50S ribosomal protein L5, partial [Gemmatimonadota bacterium]